MKKSCSNCFNEDDGVCVKDSTHSEPAARGVCEAWEAKRLKLTNEDKLAASAAMLRGDNFTRGNALMFPFGRTGEYCVMQTVGPADKCKKIETTSWNEALEKFEEFMEVRQ